MIEMDLVDEKARNIILIEYSAGVRGGVPLFRSHASVRLVSGAFIHFMLVFAICTVLAGCGRRGALEYPINTDVPRVHDSNTMSQSSGQNTQKIMRGYGIPREKFALDPLL